MEWEHVAEPPRPVPTGWWPEPDTIGWVGRTDGAESEQDEDDRPDGES